MGSNEETIANKPENYKQTIDKKLLDKLVSVLSEFSKKHEAGNPGLANEINSVAGKVKSATDEASDSGCAVVGSAQALLALIEARRGNQMYFRKPYPPEESR